MSLKEDFEFPQSEEYILRFIITKGYIYTEEENFLSFIKEKKVVKQLTHLGRINDGFLFFDNNYTIRLFFNKENISKIELYFPKSKKINSLELKVPLIKEVRFNRSNSLEDLFKTFQISN